MRTSDIGACEATTWHQIVHSPREWVCSTKFQVDALSAQVADRGPLLSELAGQHDPPIARGCHFKNTPSVETKAPYAERFEQNAQEAPVFVSSCRYGKLAVLLGAMDTPDNTNSLL